MELSADDLRSVRLPYPDVETQRLIAGYLDRETARIDALVAEKEKMLALLEEKRAALISRAVTRGLDLTAPPQTLRPRLAGRYSGTLGGLAPQIFGRSARRFNPGQKVFAKRPYRNGISQGC